MTKRVQKFSFRIDYNDGTFEEDFVSVFVPMVTEGDRGRREVEERIKELMAIVGAQVTMKVQRAYTGMDEMDALEKKAEELDN